MSHQQERYENQFPFSGGYRVCYSGGLGPITHYLLQFQWRTQLDQFRTGRSLPRRTGQFSHRFMELVRDGDELEFDPGALNGPDGGADGHHTGDEIEDLAWRELARGGGFTLDAKLAAWERAYIAAAMKLSTGNVSQAARLAGKERRAFGKLLKKHGINGCDAQ